MTSVGGETRTWDRLSGGARESKRGHLASAERRTARAGWSDRTDDDYGDGEKSKDGKAEARTRARSEGWRKWTGEKGENGDGSARTHELRIERRRSGRRLHRRRMKGPATGQRTCVAEQKSRSAPGPGDWNGPGNHHRGPAQFGQTNHPTLRGCVYP